MEEGRINDRMIIRRNSDELKTELKKVCSQIIELQKKQLGQRDKIDFAHYRISDLEQIIEEIQARHYYGITAALEAQVATMANADNPNRNTGPRDSRSKKRKLQRIHKLSTFLLQCNCAEENKVAFATGTLTDNALSWWNSYVQPIGIDQANQITWTELKRLLTNKYCPRTEVKKMEDEFYNLAVKGNDLKTYMRIFQELAVLCQTCTKRRETMKSSLVDYPEVLKEMLLPRSLKLWRKPPT
ncbi:reverse transcriptase domain-containing protein [Tanacetum coccineum]